MATEGSTHPALRRGRAARAQAARSGLPPGAAVYMGDQRAHAVRIHSIRYSAECLEERADETIEQVVEAACIQARSGVAWIDLDGVHDAALIQTLCSGLGVHSLAMEDALTPSTRPKADDYGSTLFIAARMIFEHEAGHLVQEQVSFALGPGWLVTFQEQPGDVFEEVRKRLRTSAGRIRSQGADHLLHALLDAVVDGYFEVLETLNERVERLEQDATTIPNRALPIEIYTLRGELAGLRRAVWPLRESLRPLAMERGEALIQSETRAYFRDLTDHVSQVSDLLESARDRLSAALDLHFALSDRHLNERMRVLTILATIFIPLTFIAGIYGMNFKYMPELLLPWGYPAALLFMAAVAGGMLLWFWRNRWL